jgi:hypothetical protein
MRGARSQTPSRLREQSHCCGVRATVNYKGLGTTMRLALAVILPLLLAGCLSFSSSDPPPPRTVYVPVPAQSPPPAPPPQ